MHTEYWWRWINIWRSLQKHFTESVRCQSARRYYVAIDSAFKSRVLSYLPLLCIMYKHINIYMEYICNVHTSNPYLQWWNSNSCSSPSMTMTHTRRKSSQSTESTVLLLYAEKIPFLLPDKDPLSVFCP